MKNLLSISTILISLFLFLACSDEAKTMSKEDFSKKYSDILCGKEFECCPDKGFGAPHYSTLDECKSETYTNMINKYSGNNTEFDEEEAHTCYAYVEELFGSFSCTEYSQPSKIMKMCKDVQRGLLKEGEKCGAGDCEEGLSCIDQGESGECMKEVGEGESCLEDEALCSDGLFCDDDFICQKKKQEGEACNDNKECYYYDCIKGRCVATAITVLSEMCK